MAIQNFPPSSFQTVTPSARPLGGWPQRPNFPEGLQPRKRTSLERTYWVRSGATTPDRDAHRTYLGLEHTKERRTCHLTARLDAKAHCDTRKAIRSLVSRAGRPNQRRRSRESRLSRMQAVFRLRGVIVGTNRVPDYAGLLGC